MTKQRKHRLARRALGLCGVEGCLVRTGDAYRCPGHAEEHKVAVKAAYWAKRERTARRAA